MGTVINSRRWRSSAWPIRPSIRAGFDATLRGLVRTLKARGINVEIAELRDEVVESLKLIGADQDLGSIVAHRTIDDCLATRKD
ncbi:MAG: hypothetical protein E6G76_03135 [Alphaproteobacteria bacterium]|nr:MAG: hypothetical protein E6G76_03135 [Alphaproteobacteria bacterium]